MKITPLLRIALGLFAGAVFAADKPSLRYQALANELATAFLRSTENADANLPAFLKKEEAEGAEFKAAVEKAVAFGRALIADGVASSSRHFARLLADSTGVAAAGAGAGSAGSAGGRGSGTTEAAPLAADITKAREELWRAGIDKLNNLPRTQQSVYASFNKIEPAAIDTAFRQSTMPATLENADKFLIRLGYDQKAAAAKAAGGEASTAQKAASKEGFAAIKTPAAVQTEAWFRDNGVSFAAGYGIAHYAGDDRPVGALIARWNFWQRIATAKWNQRIGENNSEGYALVPFWGKVEYYDRSLRWKEGIKSTLVDAKPRHLPVLPEFTFLGLFIGSAAAGEQVTTRGDKERPYLVGASFGWGFYKEAAPFITFDFGKTISPKHGLGSSSNYYGISLDALVLSGLTDFFRKPPAPKTGGSQ